MKLLTAAVASLAALGLAVATGCSSSTAPTSSSTQVTVTAAFYPFQFVAERVGGALVDVTNLTPPGSEPHDLELTPKQESQPRQQQQVDQIEGFGEDGQVLPGLFFLETEVIVRKWH